jgi:hypothetical protein
MADHMLKSQGGCLAFVPLETQLNPAAISETKRTPRVFLTRAVVER